MTPALRTFLDTVQCTAPFTLDDAAALHGLIKQHAPDALVEVVIEGDIVTARLFYPALRGITSSWRIA